MTGFVVYMTIALVLMYITYKVLITLDKDEIKEGQSELDYFMEEEGPMVILIFLGMLWPVVLIILGVYYIIKLIMWVIDKLIGKRVVKLTNKYLRDKY